jgi:hypothetical protein
VQHLSNKILMVSNCFMLHATHPVTIISIGMQVFCSIFCIRFLPGDIDLLSSIFEVLRDIDILDTKNRYLDWTTRIYSFALKFTNHKWSLQYDLVTIGFHLVLV